MVHGTEYGHYSRSSSLEDDACCRLNDRRDRAAASLQRRLALSRILVRYAGVYTEQEITEGFAVLDRNGNDIVCGKPFQKDRYYPLQNIRDDLPSPGS